MRKWLYTILSTLMAVQFILPSMVTQVNASEKAICNDCVATIDFSKFNKQIDEDELMLTVKQTLLNANKYALGGWFHDRKHLDQDNGTYYNLYKASGNSSTPEYIYRFPAAQSFGIAISLKTGAYDESIVGVSAEEAEAKAIKMAVSVAHEHKANTGVGSQPQYKVWGDDWQAAHWAYYAGYAAWLLWDDMTAEEQELIRNMLVHEANRFVNQNALYWKTANGKELYQGDSKIEEDSWNGELLNLTYHMLPRHENAEKWKYRMIEYQLASFATPEMNESNDIVHGRKAKDWVKGYNVNSDGTVINHNRVHPQYNAAATGVNTSIVNSVIGDSIPLAAKYNLDTLYSGLTTAHFDSPPYRAPGGTMYVDGSAEIYYPEVSDWGYGVYDTFANIDVSAYVYGYNDDAYEWALLHANKVLEQQNRYSDGHTYASGESLYPGNEEAITMRMGNSYMTLWLNKQVGVQFSNEAIEYPHEELPPLADNQQRIFATDSGYVRDGANSNTCYYPSDVMEVKKDGPGYARESFLKFDLSELDALPEQAEVYLPVVKVGDKVAPGQVINKVELVQENDWSEDTLTYNNQPTSANIVLASWIPNTDGLTIDITQYVRKAYNADKKLSLRIYSETKLGGDSFTNYGSSRQADPNYQPQLLVTYDTENADMALTGSENVDAFQAITLGLEGYHFSNIVDYDIVVEYDADKLNLNSVRSQDASLTITSVDKTTKGKTIISVKDDVVNRKMIPLSELQFQPLDSGTAAIHVSLVRNGSVILSADKTITINKEALQGSFQSTTKPNTQQNTLADTTVRIGNNASVHASRNEVDIKSNGNTADTRQAFFKFPLPTKEEMEAIDSLDLNFYVDRIGNMSALPTVRFQYVDVEWDENTLQWSNKPGITASIDGTAATIPAADENTLFEREINSVGFINFDVTEKAKELVNAGKTEMTVFVYSSLYGNRSMVLRTKEHADVATRPFINTVYKKSGEVKLYTSDTDINVNRFDTASMKVSAENVGDIDNAIMDITYSDQLKFKGLDSLHSNLNAEVLGVLNGNVRVKLTKKDASLPSDFNTDLLEIRFQALSKGDGSVTVTAQDENNNPLTFTKAISIQPIPTALNMSVSGDTKASLDQNATISTDLHSLVPGVTYQLNLDYDENYLALNNVFSMNQNITVDSISREGHKLSFKLEALESDQPYILALNWNIIKQYSGEQNISIQLADEDAQILRTHTITYDETLKAAVDKSELEAFYNAHKDMKQDRYTDSSWADFQNALNLAIAVLDNPDANQDAVDQALQRCKDMKARLQLNSSVSTDNNPARPNINKPSVIVSQQTQANQPTTVMTGDTTNAGALVIVALWGFAFTVVFMKKRKEQNI